MILHGLAEFIEMGPIDMSGWDYVDGLYRQKEHSREYLGAHYYIYPSGTPLQSLPNNVIGAHALGLNEGTIGIEMIVPGKYTYQSFVREMDKNWVRPEQLAGLFRVLDKLKKDVPTLEWLTSHTKVDPTRKTDPGRGFPYEEVAIQAKLMGYKVNF